MAPKVLTADEQWRRSVTALLRQEAFDFVFKGGPFGRDYQLYLTRSYPARAFMDGLETFQAAVKRRLKSWDDARPWSEGLATLYEVTQQELLAQYDALGLEAWEAVGSFVQLSEFQRIAYRHLMSLGDGEMTAQNVGKDRWLRLMRELDAAKILPQDALNGVPRDVLLSAKRKGLKLQSWEDCYLSAVRITLEDGKSRGLRREVTHAIHHAAKKAE